MQIKNSMSYFLPYQIGKFTYAFFSSWPAKSHC